MDPQKKYYRGPTNTVYNIDGASYGLDDSLVEAIKQSVRNRIAANTLDIPRLPMLAGRILEISRDPNASTDALVKVIVTDPSLATRILAIVNSPLYRGSTPITSLKQALVRLGLKIVRDMVFTESVRGKVFSQKSYRDLIENAWRLSLGSAIACEAISKLTGIEREGAFLTGLLHETGTPVLINAVTDFEKRNDGRSMGEEMVEILVSQLHEEIGAYVLDKWGMPATIVDAAGGHHRYRSAANATGAHRLVFAANRICASLGIGCAIQEVDFTIEHVFADLKIDDMEKINRIIDVVQREFSSLMGGFSVPTPHADHEMKPAPVSKPSPYRRAA